MRVLFLFPICAALLMAAKTDSSKATFHKDVLPVLQKNCQGCHRPGEAAPMSFLTYEETRPWAKAIREAVLLKRMPPWFADPHVGKFANDRSLSQPEIDTLVKWADTGAAEGDPKDAPAPLKFVDGWNIGEPEYLVEMPQEFEVPASGTIEYTYFVLPTGFTEDRWVRMAEARPGNRKVVHHIIAFVREPGSKWLQDAKPGEPFVPKKRGEGEGEDGGMSGEFLVGYAPGTVPEVVAPGQAKRIKAGSDIVLQMHYTANGKVETDRTRVGFIFAKEPPEERVMTIAANNRKFVIPPGADNHRVDASITLHADATLTGMLPHMHLRGKSFEYRIVFPDGETRQILNVPKYDFNWQLSYYPEEPIRLPKGTRIECTAHYDNSANNPANPDPKSEVRYGDQSWEEMMFGFFNVAFDADMDPADLFREKKKETATDD
ncbi:MAG: thiol-disulfide isomerase [Bryobacteraceae bacterium]